MATSLFYLFLQYGQAKRNLKATRKTSSDSCINLDFSQGIPQVYYFTYFNETCVSSSTGFVINGSVTMETERGGEKQHYAYASTLQNTFFYEYAASGKPYAFYPITAPTTYVSQPEWSGTLTTTETNTDTYVFLIHNMRLTYPQSANIVVSGDIECTGSNCPETLEGDFLQISFPDAGTYEVSVTGTRKDKAPELVTQIEPNQIYTEDVGMTFTITLVIVIVVVFVVVIIISIILCLCCFKEPKEDEEKDKADKK